MPNSDFIFTRCADELPTTDVTVLIANAAWRCDQVYVGYHDGKMWYDGEGMSLLSPADSGRGDAAPTHWAHMPALREKEGA